jgi:hypothetical protein
MAFMQEGCPNYTQRGNLCAIPLKKLKFEVKNKETINSYKNYQRFISKQGSIYPSIPPTAHSNLMRQFL